MQLIDLIVVAAYAAVMLSVGWRARSQSRESYWVAERQYGTWRISASLIVSIFGATATMGVIGLGYSRGLTGAWFLLPGAVALIPFGLFFAQRVRALAVFTLPDILQRAYGTKVAAPAALTIAIAWCGVVAAQMVAGAYLMNGVLPLGYPTALGLIATVFVLYTFWGGQLSVVRTDSWQLVLFVTGLVACFAFVGWNLWGGPINAQESIPVDHLRFPVSAAFGWYDVLVYCPIILGLPYLVGPDIYSRILCARDGAVARRSVFYAAVFMVPIAFLLTVLGIAIRSQYPDVAPDGALPEVISQLLPTGLRGLVVAGFLAAIMSSADTTLVTASTILSQNVLNPLRKLSPELQLRYTKASVVVIGCLAWLIASFQQAIYPSLLLGYTIFVGGVAVPTILSFFRGRLGLTSNGAMWAVIIGGSAAIFGAIKDGAWLRALFGSSGDRFFEFTLGPEYPSILPVVLSLIVILALSRLARGDKPTDGGTKG